MNDADARRAAKARRQEITRKYRQPGLAAGDVRPNGLYTNIYANAGKS